MNDMGFICIEASSIYDVIVLDYCCCFEISFVLLKI